MEFRDRIYDLASKIEELSSHLQTEEATKNALVMPFLQICGYDPFDPREVIPEFVSDVGTKKGEKVDYAIMWGGDPIILIECKCKSQTLDEVQCSQLYRYFANTSARIAILTNGIEYRFYTDLDKPNLMDPKPFMVFDASNPEEALILELQKLSKDNFDLESTLFSANELKYTREIKKIIAQEVKDPTEDLVRHFASQVYDGRLTQQWKDFFKDIVRRAFGHYINETINERLQSAMAPSNFSEEDSEQEADETEQNDKKTRIVTTEEEVQGYLIVKAILCEVIDPSRVVMRDTVSYCGILLDDNNRKPICRLHFNTANKYIGIMDKNKNESRERIFSLDDIYKYSEELKKVPAFYD